MLCVHCLRHLIHQGSENCRALEILLSGAIFQSVILVGSPYFVEASAFDPIYQMLLIADILSILPS